MSKSDNQQPDKEFRAGAISAAIWTKNVMVDGRQARQDTVRVQKRYRDGRSGEWRTTTYFRPDDLPKLILVVSRAYEHVMLREIDETPALQEKDNHRQENRRQ